MAFWHEQPASVAVVGGDFDSLWRASDSARRRFGFATDFADRRSGRLQTQPKTGAVLLEVWHDEQRTIADVAESSLATVRRSVRFDVSRSDGEVVAVPRVVVERLARRGDTFRRAEDDPAKPGFGWYATGRDVALEATLANRMAKEAGGTIRRADEDVLATLRR